MAIRPVLLAAATAALIVTQGCGNERTPPPDVRTALDPLGLQPYASKEAGLAFEAPANWRLNTAPQDTRLATVTSGEATVAVWRYPRTEPLPGDDAQLEQAKTALVERIQRRDPTFVLGEAKVLPVDEAKAVQVTGDQTLAGIRVRTRSTHVFHAKAKTEIVIDAYAPPETFERVDGRVFQPLVSSIELTPPA